jgi:hypothetical protein
MLDGEFISFVGDSVRIQVAAGNRLGNGDYVTGYLGSGATRATYTLSGLDITGRSITGVTVTAFDGFGTTGFIGLISQSNAVQAVHLLDSNRISLDLDTLVFQNRGLGDSHNVADIRIDLVSVPVPEPAAALLALGGIAVLALRLRAVRRA